MQATTESNTVVILNHFEPMSQSFYKPWNELRGVMSNERKGLFTSVHPVMIRYAFQSLAFEKHYLSTLSMRCYNYSISKDLLTTLSGTVFLVPLEICSTVFLFYGKKNKRAFSRSV